MPVQGNISAASDGWDPRPQNTSDLGWNAPRQNNTSETGWDPRLKTAAEAGWGRSNWKPQQSQGNTDQFKQKRPPPQPAPFNPRDRWNKAQERRSNNNRKF